MPYVGTHRASRSAWQRRLEHVSGSGIGIGAAVIAVPLLTAILVINLDGEEGSPPSAVSATAQLRFEDGGATTTASPDPAAGDVAPGDATSPSPSGSVTPATTATPGSRHVAGDPVVPGTYAPRTGTTTSPVTTKAPTTRPSTRPVTTAPRTTAKPTTSAPEQTTEPPSTPTPEPTTAEPTPTQTDGGAAGE